MKNIIITTVIIILIAFEGYGLPRFSLLTGSSCADCHVSPTGGGMRTQSGWNYGKNQLQMFKSESEKEISPYIGQNISLGIDFRTQYLAKFDSTSKKSDFQNMTGAVYFNIESSDYLQFYGHYDFAKSIWSGYAIANILPFNGYVKAGVFSPNFGIRLDDHTAYTRGGDAGILTATQGFIYSPYYVESGVELGFNFTDYLNFTTSVGNPTQSLFTKDPTYTSRLQLSPSIGEVNILAGTSYAMHRKGFPGNVTHVNMYGGFLGFNFADFTLLAEYDFGKNLIRKDSLSSALMIEASYKITNGLDAVIRFDRFDPNTSAQKDEVSRIIIGAEFFPYSFIEVRPQYRINLEEPKIENNAFLVQLHFWY